MRCPVGIDESSTADIGPAGGTVTLSGRQSAASGVASTLTIPPKVLDKVLPVTLTETSIPPPKEIFDWSPVYEVGPACAQAFSAMRLRLPTSNFEGGPPTTSLVIYYAKDRFSPFGSLGGVPINAGYVDAEISQFGLYLVGIPRSPSQWVCE